MFESISKQLSIYQWGLGILSLFVIASIGIPAWRGKRDRQQEQKLEELTREIKKRITDNSMKGNLMKIKPAWIPILMSIAITFLITIQSFRHVHSGF